jgi:hypothetical protein
MRIVPARFEEQANRVDRTWALVIGLFSAVVALWCVYRVFWGLYAATVMSAYGLSPITLVMSSLLWVVIGVVSAMSAIALLMRYARGPQ